MKYFLIAGEASGDLHASHLIESLRRRDTEAQFALLGGDLMSAAAGVSPVVHYKDMAFMGFSEVLRNLGAIGRNLKTARQALADFAPDALILIDYPSFNLKVASTAARIGIPVYYFISPKVWAWKKWRVKTIAKLVRKVLCILPFEPKFYRDNNYGSAVYVGNPSVGEMDAVLAAAPTRADFCRSHRLRENRNIIALLPGSRRGEIRNNLPIMDAVARRYPSYTIVVAGAPGIDDEFYKPLTRFPVVRDATHDLLAVAHAAIVTSGTATLEAALAAVPQVVVYRANGSKISYNLMRSLLHVTHVSLPDIITDADTVPELLLHHCTVDNVDAALRAITPDNSPARAAMLEGYASMRRILGTDNAPDRAAEIIINDLI